VCHTALQDPAFFRFLTHIDESFAADARHEGCRLCAGPLHVADYPRKPRGCPAAVYEEYCRRLSFTCGRCERRTTPPSVRFAGRRVYLAVVLVLFSPPTSACVRALCGRLQISPVTFKRWRQWWHEVFPATPLWRAEGTRFMPPVSLNALPHSLLERFEASAMTERVTQALRFIAPLSTRTMVR
jgi:hypothetical protein